MVAGRRPMTTTVGQEGSFADAVGHEDHRLAVGLPDAQKLDPHLVAGDRIEGAERLVHQENAGVMNERSTNRYALAHAARQLARQQAAYSSIFAMRSSSIARGSY